MKRSRKVIDAAPTWAAFSGWSVLLEHAGAGVGLARPRDSENSFARRLNNVADALAASSGVSIARLPAESWHITLCDGINTGMRRNMSPGWSRLTDPGAALATLGESVDALCLAARTAAHWTPVGVEVRGKAVVVARETDADLSEMAEQRQRLLKRLGSMVGAELVTPWHPHITLGYLLSDEHNEQRRSDCASAWVSTLPERDGKSTTLLTDRAEIYTFSDMATYRSFSLPS